MKTLDSNLSAMKVPSVSTLHKILREDFHLRYGKAQAANLKYRDPTFNEKRLWISRLLAQFLYEDAVVITVDESNFRSDQFPSKQWGFDQRVFRQSQSKPVVANPEFKPS
jgi:hypothetical protein